MGTVHSVLPSSTKAGGGQGLVDGIWLQRETGAAQSPCGSVENFVLRHWRAHGWVGFHCLAQHFNSCYLDTSTYCTMLAGIFHYIRVEWSAG